MVSHTSLLIVFTLLLVSGLNSAILIGNQSIENANSEPSHESTSVPISLATQQAANQSANFTTFHYEANEFLLNSSDAQKTAKKSLSRQDESSRKKGDIAQDESLQEKEDFAFKSKVGAGISGRNGRMLDLDALMGDFSSSQANRERSSTGNRQSRFLPSGDGQRHVLEVGGGKKLHIQGFIPIVGVKDSTEDDVKPDVSSTNEGDTQAQKPQRLHQQLGHNQLVQQTSSPAELPYAQSSLGHATFGVQRYLQDSTDHQVDAKFSGASVVDSLKKPIRALTGKGSTPDGLTGYAQQQHGQVSELVQQIQPAPISQNCLCVPFYMCKNGVISESSLSKSQFQQMISMQQQQQQLPRQSPTFDQSTLDSLHSIQRPQITQEQTQMSSGAQYSDSTPLIDERSFERDLSASTSNLTTDGSTLGQASEPTDDQPQQLSALSSSITTIEDKQQPLIQQNSNVSNNSSSNDEFSQEVLGRMLGLKSQSRSPPVNTQQNGVCGLLRTCCTVQSSHQQQLNVDNILGQTSNMVAQKQISPTKSIVNQYPNQLGSISNEQLVGVQHQQQHQYPVNQRFQNTPASPQRGYGPVQTPPKLPYGFPSQMIASPLNAPGGNNHLTALAHRSTQFAQPSSAVTRYQQPQTQTLTQLARASSAPLQQFQNNQLQQLALLQQAKMAQIPMSAAATQMISPGRSQPISSSVLGTRKILEGRCGLRQSAGINGRVQNLQYHESSADFGEYPAQVAILKRLGGSDSLFVCGGTLISQYWVATAAHCARKHSQSDLKVRLGEWDVHRDDEFYPFVEKEVRDLVIHPEFVSGNLVNDIALLRLDSPVDQTLPHVNPACLPNIDESFSRQRCWVTGWGKDSFGQKGTFQAVLREVELPVVGQAECESALRQTRLGPHYRLHSGFICAGGEGGKDACEGDGGSGLYCMQDGVIKVAGLVSWGIGCGQAGVPGVYVNMAHYRPWIENIIAIDEDIYSPYSNMIGNSLISERSNNNTEVVSTNPNTEDTTTSSTAAPSAS